MIYKSFVASAVLTSLVSLPVLATEFAVQTKFNQGMNISFVDQVSRAGVKIHRDAISWSSIETVKGQYAVPNNTQMIYRALKDRGIKTIIVLNGNNRFYDDGKFPVSDEAVNAFANYAAFVAREFKDQAVVFEVWNEWMSSRTSPNYLGAATTYNDYIKLFKAVSIAIKAAVPNAKVIADPAITSGISGYNLTLPNNSALRVAKLAALRSVIPYVDGIVDHYYPYQSGANYAAAEITRLRDIKAMHTTLSNMKGSPVPVYVTEFGWPVAPALNINENIQAQRNVKTMDDFKALGEGVVPYASYYQLYDTCVGTSDVECNFGLIRRNSQLSGKPTLEAFAIKAIAAQVSSATPIVPPQPAGPISSATPIVPLQPAGPNSSTTPAVSPQPASPISIATSGCFITTGPIERRSRIDIGTNITFNENMPGLTALWWSIEDSTGQLIRLRENLRNMTAGQVYEFRATSPRRSYTSGEQLLVRFEIKRDSAYNPVSIVDVRCTDRLMVR